MKEEMSRFEEYVISVYERWKKEGHIKSK